MSRTRDNQRSRCYAWEERASEGALHNPTWDTLEECEAFLKPVWRKERGRVGRAKVPVPTFSRHLWGQSRATASSGHVLKIPRWARNPWVVLHEAAHRLTPRDEAHGPRFVGVLIGLLARHDNRDAAALMALADEMGLRYHVRSIGCVPARGIAWRMEQALKEEKPMAEMDLACWLDVSYLQVRGAAMHLIRNGKARWHYGKLCPMGALLPPPPPPAKVPRKVNPASTKATAARLGIEIDGARHEGWMVYAPPSIADSDADPFEGDHWAGGWVEVKVRVDAYAKLLGEVAP